jgi:hypothetical protein
MSLLARLIKDAAPPPCPVPPPIKRPAIPLPPDPAFPPPPPELRSFIAIWAALWMACCLLPDWTFPWASCWSNILAAWAIACPINALLLAPPAPAPATHQFRPTKWMKKEEGRSIVGDVFGGTFSSGTHETLESLEGTGGSNCPCGDGTSGLTPVDLFMGLEDLLFVDWAVVLALREVLDGAGEHVLVASVAGVLVCYGCGAGEVSSSALLLTTYGGIREGVMGGWVPGPVYCWSSYWPPWPPWPPCW